MRSIFLDTVGLIALWDTDDQWHAAADAAYREMVSQRSIDVHDQFYLIRMRQHGSPAHFYERGDAAQAGVVDHVSFVVMRRLGITEALTNDRHFQAAGFSTLF